MLPTACIKTPVRSEDHQDKSPFQFARVLSVIDEMQLVRRRNYLVTTSPAISTQPGEPLIKRPPLLPASAGSLGVAKKPLPLWMWGEIWTTPVHHDKRGLPNRFEGKACYRDFDGQTRLVYQAGARPGLKRRTTPELN